MKSINVEGGFSFCGGWNFSKSVSVDSTFIREMRVPFIKMPAHNAPSEMISIHYHSLTKEGVDKLFLEYCCSEVMQ